MTLTEHKLTSGISAEESLGSNIHDLGENDLENHPFPNIVKKALEANARKIHSKKTKIEPENNVVLEQLPLWDDDYRSLPNEIFRSALFNAKNQNEKREVYKEIVIASIGFGVIRYSGEELRQDDATVYLQLIHLAKELPLGQVILFTAYGFCKAINWPICQKSYVRLRRCLTRMQATALSVYSDYLKVGISISMIPRFTWRNELTQKPLAKYQVEIASDLVKLFDKKQYTEIQWKQRLALPRGLATWLHGYYASHTPPFPIKITTVKFGAGLTTFQDKHLREIIKKALNELVKVGFLSTWEFVGDLIKVKRIK